jgi:ribonuclease R
MILNARASQSDAKQYANPIPGREKILKLFTQSERSLNRNQIADKLKLKSSEHLEALRRRLRAMERDGQLSFEKKAYRPIDESLLVEGVLSLHPDGFGFVAYSREHKDLYLTKNQLEFAFEGDKVRVLMSPASHGRRSSNKLISIVERNTTHIIGTLVKEHQQWMLQPQDHRVLATIQVDLGDFKNARNGQVVVTEIIDYPNYRQNTQVKVTEVIGHIDDPGIEVKMALQRHGLSNTWDDAVLEQAKRLGSQVSEDDKQGRADYRHLPFVTIDGSDAKDFDDAVYCEQKDNGEWRLMVAIADVSHYVKPDDSLDQEAQQRATSLYFPGHVVPMLPEALSNGLCSLLPNEDRLAMVCDMTINAQGDIVHYSFAESVIHSHARLTYDRVNAVLNKPRSHAARRFYQKQAQLVPHLKDLNALYKVLKHSRNNRGAIDFETQEVSFQLNEKGKISSIKPMPRHDAHKMIEEFMLCANVATAKLLTSHKVPNLFRVHEGPQQKKLDNLRVFLAYKNLTLEGEESPTPHHFQKLMQKIAHRNDVDVIRTLMLRSQSQAVYSPKDNGHFGLAFDSYAHFTSPIRRYPDLLAHRAIRSIIRSTQSASSLKRVVSRLSKGKWFSDHFYPYNRQAMVMLGEHCSNQSRLADEISREVEAQLMCQYMQHHLGEVFAARISGVNGLGFFVTLDETNAEGMVPVASLNGTKFKADLKRQELANDVERYTLGDRVEVMLDKVDERSRRMNFSLVESAPALSA